MIRKASFCATQMLGRPVADGLAAGGKYPFYRLDDLNCDRGEAYRSIRRAGRPHQEAPAEARKAGDSNRNRRAAGRCRRRSFDRNRTRGTLNNHMKNIPFMWALRRFLQEPHLQTNAVAFLLIEPARQQ